MDQVALPDRFDAAEVLILAIGGEVVGRGATGSTTPVVHRFTPGLYIREIFMPAGSVLTSKIHKTEHPFVISKGSVSVYSDNDGAQHITAPYTGITKPGTRRFLVIHEDTIWTTFHVTDKTCIEDIEDEIIEPHCNPLVQAFLEERI